MSKLGDCGADESGMPERVPRTSEGKHPEKKGAGYPGGKAELVSVTTVAANDNSKTSIVSTMGQTTF